MPINSTTEKEQREFIGQIEIKSVPALSDLQSESYYYKDL